MICSLIIGRKGSESFPGKNLYDINGRPLAWYPMDAASNCKEIDQHFISTDDPTLMELGKETGFEVINRPAYLATSDALGDEVYKHGYEVIIDRIGEKPELLVLLLCNAYACTPAMINQGINALRKNNKADSAVTVSRYNMFSPSRARRVDQNGLLQPLIPFELYTATDEINCDRDSQGDVWFADFAMTIIRPENLEKLDEGLLPAKWMGQKILPIYNEAGLDVDYEWQIGQVEWWIKNRRH